MKFTPISEFFNAGLEKKQVYCGISGERKNGARFCFFGRRRSR